MSDRVNDTDNDEGSDKYIVPALERGLKLLGEFSRDNRRLGPPELARRLGLPRSTVFRLLTTLESMGFIERSEGGSEYQLGMAVLRLGFEYLASLGIVELGRSLLEGLRDATGHSASLVVRDGRDVVYLHRVAPRSPFSTAVSVGTRLPAHATVLGQVLLGDLALAELRALYPEGQLQQTSPRTPPTVQALFDSVQRTRARGWVVSEGYFESQICTVAAPVRDATGHVVAAIGLTIPGSAIPAAQRDELVARVTQAAAELSARLNYRAPADEAPDEAAEGGLRLVQEPGSKRVARPKPGQGAKRGGGLGGATD